MAFSNIRSTKRGNGLTEIFGDFTQTQGGGSQTYAVSCGRVLLVQVNPQVTSEPIDGRNTYSVSKSNNIVTLTIYGNSAITAGTFYLLVDAGG